MRNGQSPSKADKLKLLFMQGWSPRDAAAIAETTSRHARRVRDQMRGITAGMTVRQEVARLHQDLRDLRKLVLSHIEQSKLERLAGHNLEQPAVKPLRRVK